MTASWNDRLRSLVKEKGISKSELARRSGLKEDRVRKWLSENLVEPIKQPRGDAIERLADVLGVDAIWLRHGLTFERHEDSDRLLSLLQSAPVVTLTLLSTLKTFDDLDALIKAGPPFSSSRRFGPRCFLVPVEDDSMAPRYPQGTVLVVDPDAPPIPGKCVVANVIGHGAVCRRVRTADGKKLELHPENPDSPF